MISKNVRFSYFQAFVSTGTNLQLIFNPCANSYTGTDYCDFDKEKGKVSWTLNFKLNPNNTTQYKGKFPNP